MLLQGQDDAICDNCSQDHVLKWSVGVKEHLKMKLHIMSFHNNIMNFKKKMEYNKIKLTAQWAIS